MSNPHEILKALKEAEAALRARRARLAEWDVPGARVEYVRELKRSRREKALPADRRCPLCQKVKLKSRQWVLLDRLVVGDRLPAAQGRTVAVCKSCAILKGLQ